MVKRNIINIDEDKCNGCGLCIPNCPEGAIQLIDEKARLISDLFCDGLGACLGHCPEGAICLEEREAEPYDEGKVMENIVKHGENTIKAHLEHLKDHGEDGYFQEALNYLKEKGIENPLEKENDKGEKNMHASHPNSMQGCPGAKAMDFSDEKDKQLEQSPEGHSPSHLKQWPVQLHLISPSAPYFHKKDILIAADCTAFSLGDFHKDFLKGRSLAIGCPKLDSEQEVYVDKIKSMIDDAEVNTITVMIMEVPCCAGLLNTVKEASEKAERKVPIKAVTVGIKGDIIGEEWV